MQEEFFKFKNACTPCEKSAVVEPLALFAYLLAVRSCE
jgi:hypothetical protein